MLLLNPAARPMPCCLRSLAPAHLIKKRYPAGVTPAATTVATMPPTVTTVGAVTPTLHWFAHVCQRPHTSYVADDNPKRQGFCVCAASAVCIGTWCEVVSSPDSESKMTFTSG